MMKLHEQRKTEISIALQKSGVPQKDVGPFLQLIEQLLAQGVNLAAVIQAIMQQFFPPTPAPTPVPSNDFPPHNPAAG